MAFTAISGCTPPGRINQPVEVISVSGPRPPFNPGGPVVEITLNNISNQPVVSLAAILKLNRDFNFDYDVSSSKPLLPGVSINSRMILITGGFSDNVSYPLLISGTLQNGTLFSYTNQVQIKAP